MFAVRLHGRGGQGIVTTAELLAVAVFNEGGHAQAFPTFGSERTGAPVAAYCRIDDVPIRTHEPVATPDALIVADATLFGPYLGLLAAPAGDARAGADFDRLNLWYYSDAPATVVPQLAAARRVDTFDEVVTGLTEETALYEARRCLSCGNCFECDNCYSVCPDNAITKLGPGQGYAVDVDFCKGCGLCAAECPAGAIEMLPLSV